MDGTNTNQNFNRQVEFELGDSPLLDLDSYIPNKLTLLAGTLNRILADVYETQFGLTTAEWRLIAVLARVGVSSANGICERTAMDKVRVSRAVARAVNRGLINRAIDKEDRRRSVLTLTAEGRRIHDAVVPRAFDCERQLLSVLSADDIDSLTRILDLLQARAGQMAPRSETVFDDD